MNKQRKRFCFERAGGRCEICTSNTSNLAALMLGSDSSPKLHIHHIYPKKSFPQRERSKFLIVVCQECHTNVEGRLGTRLQVINWGRAAILRSAITSFREGCENEPLLANPSSAGEQLGGTNALPGIHLT